MSPVIHPFRLGFKGVPFLEHSAFASCPRCQRWGSFHHTLLGNVHFWCSGSGHQIALNVSNTSYYYLTVAILYNSQ